MASEETIAVNALTAQTAELVDTCLAINAGVTKKIADAVDASTNAAIIPLMTMTKNLIDTQTLLVTFISR